MSDRQKAHDLYKSWTALVDLKVQMGERVLELIAHPDSTPEHVAKVMPRYKDVVAMLRKHKPVMIKALNKLNPVLARYVEAKKI